MSKNDTSKKNAPKKNSLQKIDAINALDIDSTKKLLLEFCSSTQWIESMVNARPYKDSEHMLSLAESLWLQASEADILEAFLGHPKIGDLNALKNKYAHHATSEQGQVADAQEEILQQLQQCNERYEQQFGFIFIVCATGKSASQMLNLIKQRIINSRDDELRNGANEQLKIIHLRIQRWLEDSQ